MTMPVRWTLLLFIILLLITLLALSRISTSSAGSGRNLLIPSATNSKSSTNWSSRWHRIRKNKKSSSLQLHHLQEEEHLRNAHAQILQDLEEDDQQLEIDCAWPPMAISDTPSWQTLSREEQLLQEADFERELAREVQRLVQKHQYDDGTDLNKSPSAIQRHLERKLRHQKQIMSAHRASLRQHGRISYNSQECIAWRARRGTPSSAKGQQRSNRGQQNRVLTPEMAAAAALTRFQQLHPGRHDLKPNSIFAQTLNALTHKQYKDPSGFIVELDPIKIMAGSRRASTYQNDDIHVLVLDMQWDPEVTVVVGNVLDETVKLRQEGYRPVMLNVGNSQLPGGDYHLDTATSNEADLFRRTTLHQCLDQEPRRSRFYPIQEFGGVYCPNQAVFRHGMDHNNDFMDRFEWISVVLETREKEGGLGGVQFLEGEDETLRKKILAAMKVGVSQGHDALVLPPHGTDAGQNPPEAIAAIYRSIIGRDFMGGRKRFQTYKKIVMVLDPEQAYKIVNETSSYRPAQPLNTTTTPLPEQGDETESGEEKKAEEEEDGDQEEKDDQEVQDKQGGEATQEKEEDGEKQQEADGTLGENGALERRYVQGSNDDQESFASEKDGMDEQDEEEEDEEGGEVDEKTTDEGLGEEKLSEELDDGEQTSVDGSESEKSAQDEEDRRLMDDDDDGADLTFRLGPEVKGSKDDNLDDGDTDLHFGSVPSPTTPDKDADTETEEKPEEENDGEEHEEEEKVEEVFEPLIETVKDVFERMLEQRSLLIVKNRARGLIDPEDPENVKPPSTVVPSAESTLTPNAAA
ncbi:hypothetical protein BGX34_003573 [Mortierella sp. NVP85]|nr:hypothetical protein BGX34_003573 [Mortierella sp. NVP85]